MKTFLKTAGLISMGLAILNMNTGALQNLIYSSAGWNGFPNQDLHYGYMQVEYNKYTNNLMILRSNTSPNPKSMSVACYNKVIDEGNPTDINEWEYVFDRNENVSVPNIDYVLEYYDIVSDNLVFLGVANVLDRITVINDDDTDTFGRTFATFRLVTTESTMRVWFSYAGAVYNQFIRDYSKGVVKNYYEPRYASVGIHNTIPGTLTAEELAGLGSVFHKTFDGGLHKAWGPDRAIGTPGISVNRLPLDNTKLWRLVLAVREVVTGLGDLLSNADIYFIASDAYSLLGGSGLESSLTAYKSGNTLASTSSRLLALPRYAFEVVPVTYNGLNMDIIFSAEFYTTNTGLENVSISSLAENTHIPGIVSLAFTGRPAYKGTGSVAFGLTYRLSNLYNLQTGLGTIGMAVPGGGYQERTGEVVSTASYAASLIPDNRILFVASSGTRFQKMRHVYGSELESLITAGASIYYIDNIYKTGRVEENETAYTTDSEPPAVTQYVNYTSISSFTTDIFPWKTVSEYAVNTSSIQRVGSWCLQV